jgi:N-acetylmuramic acid 6-phosphate etherase
MVDLQPRSRKLVARGLRMIQELGRVPPAKARVLLRQARGRVKPAILMARKKISYAEAVRRLNQAGGFLRRSLSSTGPSA